MKQGCAWIVISRPDRLPMAIAAAQSLRDQFCGGVHLVREHSKWWERAQWQPYASQFTELHAMKRVETCRGLRDLPRLYRQSMQRRRALASLPINAQQDVILCLGGILTISNVAVSAHPRARKILGASAKVYRQLSRTPDRARFRFTTASWFQNRLVEPMANINRTLRFKPRINPGGDGVRLERMQCEPEDVYDAIVVMSNSGNEIEDEPAQKIIAATFPSIADLHDLPFASDSSKQRRVIFFGTPFLLIHNLSPEAYAQHLNRCLEYLVKNFPGRELIYRPHPIETEEASRIELRDFKIEDDREAAELYFLRNYQSIEAVFSVSSTVSRTALNNGLNGYALYPCFPFSAQQNKFFANVMGDVPAQFTIGDLQSSPQPYQPVTKSGRSFAEALELAVAAVYDGPVSA